MSKNVVATIMASLSVQGFTVELSNFYGIEHLLVTKNDSQVQVGFMSATNSPFYVRMRTRGPFGGYSAHYTLFGEVGDTQFGCTCESLTDTSKKHLKYLAKQLKKSKNTIESIVDAIMKFHQKHFPEKTKTTTVFVDKNTGRLDFSDVPDGTTVQLVSK